MYIYFKKIDDYDFTEFEFSGMQNLNYKQIHFTQPVYTSVWSNLHFKLGMKWLDITLK